MKATVYKEGKTGLVTVIGQFDNEEMGIKPHVTIIPDAVEEPFFSLLEDSAMSPRFTVPYSVVFLEVLRCVGDDVWLHFYGLVLIKSQQLLQSYRRVGKFDVFFNRYDISSLAKRTDGSQRRK